MSIIYFILVLSIVVFIHELGHFVFAKRAKIYVYEFSIGMGPQIFKFKRKNDETVYSIRLFPIGGFCSLAGEAIEDDKDLPKNSKLQDKTWMQRFLTIIAGVMFNFIFAIFIFFCVGLFTGIPNNKPVVSQVVEDSPAYIAGIETGENIIAINGKKTNNTDRFLIEYQVRYGEELIITTTENEYTIFPVSNEDGSFSYGFGLDSSIEYGFFEAVKYGFTKFFSLIEQMFVIIAYLITGTLSLNSLSGPIGIFNVVGASAAAGFLSIINLIAYLSINVGFINLLPIPAFDGGRIIFLIIEKIKGSPISSKVENYIHTIGFIFLMALMVVITYNDIVRFIIN